MSKIIKKWWIGGGFLLLGIYIYGYRQMYFHQDDLDWFLLARQTLGEIMRSPVADHINYLFRGLLKLEWSIFGWHYPPYLAVSLILHTAVIGLIYQIAWLTSRRRDLAAVAAILFTINTNWNEVILWTSGQTISITAVFVLVATYYVYKQKYIWQYVALACLTSALALGLPIAALVAYGIDYNKYRVRKVGWQMIAILAVVALIYRYLGSGGTRIAVSAGWTLQVIAVWVGAMVNTVMGRLLLPFDRFEILRIGIVLGLLTWVGWKYRNRIGELWSDSWARFLCLEIAAYYLIVSLGRAQFGIGIMRAERYSYLGLALLLLLMVYLLRKTVITRWMWVVPVIVLLQSVGFYVRAARYVVRPQQLQNLVEEIKSGQNSKINDEDYLPHFVLNDERLKYRDLRLLIKD